MALKGRLDLNNLTGTNLPTNNSKQITAAKHREVVEALVESNFNLKDDELALLKFDAQQTLKEKLAGLFRDVIKRGSFYDLNIGFGSVGDTLNAEGIVSTATITTVSGPDTQVRVVFSESIENKVVIPVVHFTGSSFNSSNDLACPVIKIISSTQIDIGFREINSNSQSLKVEFIIL